MRIDISTNAQQVPGIIPGQEPLVCDPYKFVYQPMTKVGCKTFKTWMFMLDVLQEYDFNPEDKIHQQEITRLWDEYTTDHFDKSSSFSIHAMCNENYGMLTNRKQIDDYHKLVIVRNPWDRIASCYIDKCTQNKQYYKVEMLQQWYMQTEGATEETFDENDRFTFIGFLTALNKVFTNKVVDLYDPHWLPQTSVMEFYLKEFDSIIKIENIDSEFNKLKEVLKVPITPSSKTYVDKQIENGIQTKNKTKVGKYDKLLTPEANELIFNTFQYDVETLKYEK